MFHDNNSDILFKIIYFSMDKTNIFQTNKQYK